MIDLANGIDSLTHFKRNTSILLKQLHESGQPLVLTVNGKAAVVVQDVASYQRLLEVADRLEAIEAIRQGLDEMKAGKGQPADEAFEEIRRTAKAKRGT